PRAVPPARRLAPLVLLAACHATAPPRVRIAPAPPRPPGWPVAVRVLTWGAGGLVERGRLPGMDPLPTEPWLVEPVTPPVAPAPPGSSRARQASRSSI